MAKESLNTPFAKEKLTPCLASLSFALDLSHSNFSFIKYWIPVVKSSAESYRFYRISNLKNDMNPEFSSIAGLLKNPKLFSLFLYCKIKD